jgi:aspartyl-tRNA(Asn)/glutamyl-tRNA(Gln) amidotransferase subunit C
MTLSREEVLHIAALAKVGVTEADVEKFKEQLSNIMVNFEALQKLDTRDVLPTSQSIALQNVIKPDEVHPSMSQDDVLFNAPQREGNFFKVKIVLED